MQHRTILLTILFALLLLAQPNAQAEGETYYVYLPLLQRAPPAGQTLEQYQMAQEVLALVNAQRASANPACAPLAMNEKLTLAAQRESQDMALNNFFSHTNPDPSRATLVMRVEATGYNWQALAENIAAGYSSSASAMSGWMNSDGHRANILDCTYTEIGIGYYYQSDDQPLPSGGGPYYHYWTQVFGRPR
ncbi:SCP-like extracellular [Oscillochloris trichoides DG-6]|uniref:SCP-like extracellular n=1 Tax=Oscillochloris trichoides DG-6 TaxID=765420 RepID=E1IBP8_9CHLR|nr:CAP domain-containing protein [Oscillochloris trichoides]EFO81467.1 SCP-like extracellular [Oscillochloris trichoides DG-6]